MISPNNEVLAQMADICKNRRAFMSWLEAAYRAELEQLPNVGTNVQLAQGRVQMLAHLYKLISTSPDTVR